MALAWAGRMIAYGYHPGQLIRRYETLIEGADAACRERLSAAEGPRSLGPGSPTGS